MAAPEQDPFARLETLARDTDELRPTNDFSDAVMAALETTSAASILEKAKRETAELAPTDDFVASVMQSVGTAGKQGRGPARGESDWNARVVRFSRFALMGAAAAAGFCLWLSIQAESRFDATILEDVAELEVDE
jgi:hypothetical protein